MLKMEMYSINTCNSKGAKIKKQTTKNGVQFNFVPFEGVSSSCTLLGNTSEPMVMSFERTNQVSLKLHILTKSFESSSPIGVKKDGLILLVYNSKGQRLVFHLFNIIFAEPAPLKGFLL